MYIAWPGLADSVEPDEIMYLSDGRIRLRVQAARAGEGEFDAVVEIGGAVASRQGLNIPGEAASLPVACRPRTSSTCARARRSASTSSRCRSSAAPRTSRALREHTRLPLIAKIEKPQAVQRAEEIVRAADCVMVARGDLGIELRIEDVPIVQKQVLELAGALARPSITATQMLDSMVVSSRPTRAEVTDVANAILDGTDAVMLSQESAVGQHPIGAVAMMASIAERTEQIAPYRQWNEHRVRRDRRDPAYTVAYMACRAAHELGLAALVCPTLSGRSARLISAHRPTVPIYALSPGRETVRRCGLMWGVRAASMKRYEITEDLIRAAAARVVELGWVKPRRARRASPRACRPGSRAPRACCRSRRSRRSASPRRTRPPGGRARSPGRRGTSTRARRGGSCRARAAATARRA